MSVDAVTDTEHDEDPLPGRAPRKHRVSARALLVVALVVLVVSLGLTALTVLRKGDGADPVDRLQSLRQPPVTAITEREQALTAARTFVQRFGTYNPGMLDAQGKLPEYAAIADLMTPKFAKVFEENVTINEETVKQSKIDSKATVFAVGVSSIDPDSAQVLVGSIIEYSLPSPDDATKQVSFDPRRFRYQVSLVRIGDAWKVDDLDDVDDELPSFGQASAPQTGQVPLDPAAPASPGASTDPSTAPTPGAPASTPAPAPSEGSTP